MMKRRAGSRLRAVALLLTGVTLAGCSGGPAVETSPATDVDVRGWRATACGDSSIYLYPEAGTSLVTILSPMLAERTAAAGGQLTEVKAVGDDEFEVTLTIGRNLDQAVCNDAIEREPVVFGTSAATSGSFTFDTVAAGEGMLAFLTMTIDGLQFDDVTVGPSPHTVTDLQIGWYVG